MRYHIFRLNKGFYASRKIYVPRHTMLEILFGNLDVDAKHVDVLREFKKLKLSIKFLSKVILV